MKKIFSLFLIFALLLTSCQKPKEEQGMQEVPQEEQEQIQSNLIAQPHFSENGQEYFEERRQVETVEAKNPVTVQLNGTSATSSNSAAKVSGSTVTLTQGATYLIKGSLEDGMILVEAGKNAQVQIVFQGASIASSQYAPLYVKSAGKVLITLEEGTQNSLISGESFSSLDENIFNAALFSKVDLTLGGEGELTVRCPAGHGISSKDDLAILGGKLTLQSAAHGLDANDSILIEKGALNLSCGKDGIHAQNNSDDSLGYIYIKGGTFEIDAQGDGISAGNSLQIQGGTFDVTCGGGAENGTKKSSDQWGVMGGGPGGSSGDMGGKRPQKPQMRATSAEIATDAEESTSMKGLKAGSAMKIEGGTFKVDSADDAFHSDSALTVAGGTFTIATGDDGFHAETALTVQKGTVEISTCYEGLEATDVSLLGGDIKLTARDDGINAAGGNDESGSEGGRDAMFGGPMGPHGGASSNGSVTIGGVTLYIHSSGDGIDANGILTISGGHTTIIGPTQGDTATLDYDKEAIISGGTFIGTGAAGMAQTFSAAEQGVIAVKIGNQAANTTITVKDEAGTVLLTHTPDLSYAVFIYSSPQLKKGATYTIAAGSSEGEATAS